MIFTKALSGGVLQLATYVIMYKARASLSESLLSEFSMAMGGGERPKFKRSISWTFGRFTPTPVHVRELPDWSERSENIGTLKESYLWKYPFHAFIGEVLRGQP